jgi:hypothetical protein
MPLGVAIKDAAPDDNLFCFKRKIAACLLKRTKKYSTISRLLQSRVRAFVYEKVSTVTHGHVATITRVKVTG